METNWFILRKKAHVSLQIVWKEITSRNQLVWHRYQKASLWKTLLLFRTREVWVAVGYMDPGNWLPVWWRGHTATSSYQWFFSLVFNRHAVATNGWETRDCPSWDSDPTTAHHWPNGFAIPFGLWLSLPWWRQIYGSHRSEGSSPPLWLALAFPFWSPSLMSLLLLGLMHLGFGKIEAIVSTFDPHDPCDFWLSGLSFGNQISGDLRWLPSLKRGVRELDFQKEMKPQPCSWNHRSNGDAPQPSSPLFHFANAKSRLQGSSRYQTAVLYDLGFKYWIEL